MSKYLILIFLVGCSCSSEIRHYYLNEQDRYRGLSNYVNDICCSDDMCWSCVDMSELGEKMSLNAPKKETK